MSLVVQWLRLWASNAGGMGLILVGELIPHATWCGQKIKKKKKNLFNVWKVG